MRSLKVKLSEQFVKEYHDLPFGLARIENTVYGLVGEAVMQSRESAYRFMNDNSGKIEATIKLYTTFFEQNGFQCPLVGQFRSAIRKGLPEISPYVDVLLLCELTHGILMGIQDMDAMEGNPIVDIAKEGERFVGMRNTIVCHEREIVLRDNKGIIASYFQGPDKRTEVKKSSKNIIVYGFFAPGVEQSLVHGALNKSVELLSFKGKTDSEVDIFTGSED